MLRHYYSAYGLAFGVAIDKVLAFNAADARVSLRFASRGLFSATGKSPNR